MDQAIAYLKNLPFTEVKPGLERVSALLDAVGNPQHSLQTVHITGTNGKGSVSAMIASVLRCAGYRTGLYTSPHLISYRERMQILPLSPSKGEGWGEGWISEKDFCELVNELMPLAESLADRPTQFEFLTALAFLYFARQRVDMAVIEVGMGGRFDATNVITPLVSVLTNVELDHTEFLGPTIEKIAWEKAGIAKPHVPFVTGERKPEALAVIERECAAVGAPLVLVRERARRVAFTWEYQEFVIEALTPDPSPVGHYGRGVPAGRGEGLVRLALLGGYQQENLNIVLETLDVLKRSLAISENAVREGLERAQWPGRFEVVQREPYVIVLDGAHNPHAARALRDDLRRYIQKYKISKKLLLFGVLQDKDYAQMAQTLFPEFDEIVLVKPESHRALDPTALLKWAPRARIAADVATALEVARAAEPELLCVTGSLYLIGAVKKLLLEAISKPVSAVTLSGSEGSS